MKHFTKLAAAFTLMASLAATSAWAGEGWMTNFEKAQEKAKTEDRLLLMDFTGKGWCGWCTKLTNEVFDKPAFKEFADKNLVLLELDFQQPGKLPKDLEAQNTKLMKKYGVKGFPTIIVLNPAGEKVGQLGYQPGGPEAFIAKLKEMQKS